MNSRFGRESVFVLVLLLVGSVLSSASFAQELVLWDSVNSNRTPEVAQWLAGEFLPKFEKETGISVTYERVPLYSERAAKIKTGEGPDLLIAYVDNFTGLGSYLLPLKPYLDRWPEVKSISSRFSKYNWRSFPNGTYMSFLNVGLPIEVRPFGIMYDKQAYRQAGLDPNLPPQSWEEFELAAQKLTIKRFGSIRKGFDTKWNEWPFLYTLLQMNGEVGVSSDLRKSKLNTEPAVEAFGFLSRLYQLAYPPKNYGTVDYGNLSSMVDGATAMTWADPLVGVRVQNRSMFGNDVGLFLPRRSVGMEPKVFAYWNAIGILKATDKPEVAWTFIEWLYEPENTVLFHSNTHSIPSRSDVGDLFAKASPNLVDWYNALRYFNVEAPTGLSNTLNQKDNLELVFQGLSGRLQMRGVLEQINSQYQQYLDAVWANSK